MREIAELLRERERRIDQLRLEYARLHFRLAAERARHGDKLRHPLSQKPYLVFAK
jgi:hypothetical protein